MRFLSRWEGRQVRATSTYNFGSCKLKAARQRRTSTEDEQSRGKQLAPPPTWQRLPQKPGGS